MTDKTYNTFIRWPAAVHIVDPRKPLGQARARYVFVGLVPNYVREAIETISSDGVIPRKSERPLAEFYGPQFAAALRARPESRLRRGGARRQVAAEGDVEDPLMSAEDREAQLYKGLQLSSGLESIDVSEADLLATSAAPPVMSVAERINLEPSFHDDGSTHYVFDICVYPFDKISELKRKVYLAANVPPYRQHLFWLGPGSGDSGSGRGRGRADEAEDREDEEEAKYPYVLYTGIPYNIDCRALNEGSAVAQRQALEQEHGSRYGLSSGSHSPADLGLSAQMSSSGALMSSSGAAARHTHTTFGRDTALYLNGVPIDKLLYQRRHDIKVEARDEFILCEVARDFYVVDLQQFVGPYRLQLQELIADKYQLELFYFGFVIKYWPQLTIDVFPALVSDEQSLYFGYPDLAPSRRALRQQYDSERAIVNGALALSAKARGAAKTTTNITQALASALTPVASAVNLRNLFDMLEATPTVVQINAYLTLDSGRDIVLKKRWHTHSRDVMVPALIRRDVVLCIALSKDSLVAAAGATRGSTLEQEYAKFMYVCIGSDGRYLVRAAWPEEAGSDFDFALGDLKARVNPLLQIINGFGKYVFPLGGALTLLTARTIVYKSLTICIFWKRAASLDAYKFFKHEWLAYLSAGLIVPKGIQQTDAMEMLFVKGMTSFDITMIHRTLTMAGAEVPANYYAYLSDKTFRQKWLQLYTGRVWSMAHRLTDIKFEITQVVEREFELFSWFVHAFIAVAASKYEASAAASSSSGQHHVRLLRKLKEADPELYNLKRHGSSKVYSIVCQNPRQPLIYTDDEYEGLSEAARKKVLRYWNFTLNKPAYYGCPSRKYPHLSFVVGVHPKGYCIPCCGKSVGMAKTKRLAINERCLRDHVFSLADAEPNERRHILTYRRGVEPGRLMLLPSAGPTPLSVFFEAAQGSSAACKKREGEEAEAKEKEKEKEKEGTKSQRKRAFLVYTVTQQLPSLTGYAGALFAIANALDISPQQFVTKCVELCSERPALFSGLLNGLVATNYKSVAAFQAALQAVMRPNSAEKIALINAVFVELALHMNIFCVVCAVSGSGSGAGSGSSSATDSGGGDRPQIICSELFRLEAAKAVDATFIFLLKDQNRYHPIYLFEGDRLSDAQRTFTREDKVVAQTLAALGGGPMPTKGLSLGAMVAAGLVVECLFVNSQNLIYAVKGLWRAAEAAEAHAVYLPCVATVYKADKAQAASFEPFDPAGSGCRLETALALLELLRAPAPDYYLEFEGKVIGAHCAAGMLYFEAAELAALWPRHITRYHPLEVNKAICGFGREAVPAPDPLAARRGAAFYNNLTYQLFLLEFVDCVTSEKNTKLRARLTEALRGNMKTAEFVRKFDQLMQGHEADRALLEEQIYHFHAGAYTRETLLKTIETTHYEFDSSVAAAVKKMRRPAVVEFLRDYVKRFAAEGVAAVSAAANTETPQAFPNIYVPCAVNEQQPFCDSKRRLLLVPDLNSMIECLADDLVNPIKAKYIFMGVLTANQGVDFFDFVERPTEYITLLQL